MHRYKYLLKAVNSNFKRGMLKSGDADQLLGTCLAYMKSWAQPPKNIKPDLVSYRCNPSTQSEGWRIGHSRSSPRRIELETRFRYTIPCLKEKSEEQRQRGRGEGRKKGRKERLTLTFQCITQLEIIITINGGLLWTSHFLLGMFSSTCSLHFV